MSYQFEDESALEELLNQQLDRKRQESGAGQPQVSADPKQVQSGAHIAGSDSRASAGLLLSKQAAAGVQAEPSGLGAEPARGRLAGWLAGASREAPSRQDSRGPGAGQRAGRRGGQQVEEGASDEPWTEAAGLTEEGLAEARLQEMSKQRLIRLIVEQVRPALRRWAGPPGSGGPGGASRRLEEELERARQELGAARARLADQEAQAEARWRGLSRQLELRLEAQAGELQELRRERADREARLQEEFEGRLASLAQAAKERLDEERARHEEGLRRRDELHRLELECRLRTDCDLARLEAGLAEWSRRLESGARQLQQRLGRAESLLADWSGRLGGQCAELDERQAGLREQVARLERLCPDELAGLVGGLAGASEASRALLESAGARLAELSGREAQVRGLQAELEGQRELQLRHGLALELREGRLACREQRLEEARGAAQVREARLAGLRQRLQGQWLEWGRRRRRLRLAARALLGREQALARRSGRLQRLSSSSARLARLGAEARAELDQLRRLQGSLICSLCLERLFGGPANRWPSCAGPPRPAPARCAHSDARQLARETRFVELLASSG